MGKYTKVRGMLAATLLFAFLAQGASAFTLNVTTDIHAGAAKKRDYTKYTPGNVIYPKKWGGAFDHFLATPGEVYLSLGDNSNTCKDAKKHDKKIAAKVAKSGKTVLFGYGNHDCDPYFSRYLHPGSKYYSYDRGNWRIIVLNSEEANSGGDEYGYGLGGFSQTQIDWLKGQVNTDKKVVLAISKPAFMRDLVTPKHTYAPIFQIINENSNIKHVLGGDYHVFHETRVVNGVQYHYVQALTLKSAPGRFLQLSLE